MNSSDFSIEKHGNIFLLQMKTRRVVAWVAENVQPDAQYFGDALVVEHRYARNLVAGILQDGLTVE